MTLKIGLVGTGNVAKSNYIPCLAGQEDVELGYYNRTKAKADAVAAEFGGEAFDTLEALLTWSPDSVFVLTRERSYLLRLRLSGFAVRSGSFVEQAEYQVVLRASHRHVKQPLLLKIL